MRSSSQEPDGRTRDPKRKVDGEGGQQSPWASCRDDQRQHGRRVCRTRSVRDGDIRDATAAYYEVRDSRDIAIDRKNFTGIARAVQGRDCRNRPGVQVLVLDLYCRSDGCFRTLAGEPNQFCLHWHADVWGASLR